MYGTKPVRRTEERQGGKTMANKSADRYGSSGADAG
jgi:hypothetical protein